MWHLNLPNFWRKKAVLFAALCLLIAWCGVVNLTIHLLTSDNIKQGIIWISRTFCLARLSAKMSSTEDHGGAGELRLEQIQEVFSRGECGKMSFPVLLNADAIMLEDAVEELWSRRLPYGLKDVPMDDVVRIIQHFQPILNDPWFVPYPSANNQTCENVCIVVGSGGILLDYDFGSLIDTYDIVIRLNQAPTVDYEKHVGTKTSIRIMYPASSLLRDFDQENANNSDVSYVITLQSTSTWPWLDSVWNDTDLPKDVHFWRRPGDPHQYHDIVDRLFLMHPAVFQEATEMLGIKKRPTTGLAAVFFASQICKSVDIAGFSYNKGEPASRSHYYDQIPMGTMVCKPRDDDDIEAEVRFLGRLIDLGFVTDLTGGVEDALSSWMEEESEACKDWNERTEKRNEEHNFVVQ